MAHQIETMAYTNEVPWHGLGHHVATAPSVADMVKLAGLDWKVERQPMYLADGTAVRGFAALTRDKDGAVLDVVGSRYQPAQNAKTFEFFNDFVRAGQATMETAGSLKGGRMVWGLARINHDIEVSRGDKVRGYILLASPHEQGKSIQIKFTNIRVVCNNTITAALRSKSNTFRVSHATEFNELTIDKAKDALGIARDQMDEFGKDARKLKSTKLDDEKAREVLTAHLGDSRKLEAVMASYKNAPGADPGNAWGVLNGVTYWADHLASRTQDKRLTNSWFGKTGTLKQKVMSDLLELT